MTLAIAYGDNVEAPPYASLREAIFAAVERIPDGHFIHAKANAPRRTSTFRETLEQAVQIAAGLRERGMRPGDGLIINLRESADFIPTIWAAAIGGFVAAPLAQNLGWRFGSKGAFELLAFVGAALRRATLITDDIDLAVIAPINPLFFDAFVYETRGASDLPKFPEGGGDRLCLAIPTSGATGRPKMVGLNESAVLSRWWPRVPDAESDSAFLSWSPFDHVMGLGLAAPNLKRKVHLDAASFVADPLIWLDVMEETGATHATMTNFGLSIVIGAVEAAPEKSWRLETVRKIGVGAEPVNRTLCRRFLDRLAPFGLRKDSVILGYGLTECGPVVGGATAFSPSTDEPADGRILLDGPTMGHAVRVAGEDGQILNENCVGAIEVRGPTMTCGYIGDQAATSRLFTADGWLRTGDLGILEDGKLAIIGREKELIFVNARKYSCQEIEEAVKARCDFAEIYAAPLDRAERAGDPDRGKPFAIFVAVEDTGDFALAEVAAAVRGALAAAYRFAPEAVALIRRRDVPRTPLGKVQRLKLAAAIEEPRFGTQVHRLDSAPPRRATGAADSETDRAVAAAWARLLHCPEDFDRDADFFALGGDSVLALQLSLALEEKFGFAIPFEQFHDQVSVREIARFIDARRSAAANNEAAAPIPIQAEKLERLPDSLADRLHVLLRSWPGTPAVRHGFLRRVGTAQNGVPVFWCLQWGEEADQVGRTVGSRRPVFAMRSGAYLVEYGTAAAKALARRYADEIKQSFPGGPYVIAGTCQGCIVALDVARDLMADGDKVQALVIADTPPFELFQNIPFTAPVVAYVASRSKFNPYRRHRFPAQGLKKLLPAGCRMSVIPAGYTEIMQPEPFARLAEDLEDALAWSAQASGAPSNREPGILPESAYRNRIFASVFDLTLAPGETADLDLTLLNGGPADWEFESSGIAVGNHWLSENGEVVVWSDGRTPLTEAVAAGSKGAARLTITAPPAAGRYLLEVDLVEEGVMWFAESKSPPLHIPVVVEDCGPAKPGECSETGRESKRSRLDRAIRDIRSDVRAASLPGWRRLSAKLFLSLAKRAVRSR